jgi:DNA polymerase III gamma/tau subunit
VAHLQNIAKKEGITISDEALYVLADHAKGSFRDSINLLDQLASASKTISETDVHAALGTAAEESVASLMQALHQKNAVAILNTLSTLRQQGTHAAEIAHKCMAALRVSITKDPQELTEATMTLLTDLLAAQAHPEPFIALELALLKQCQVATAPITVHAAHSVPSTLPQQQPAPHAIPAVQAPKPTEKDSAHTTEEPKQTTYVATQEGHKATTQHVSQPEAKEAPAPVQALPSLSAADNEFWQAVLQALKGQYTTLYNTLRMADAVIEGEKLSLAFQFAFHQKQIAQAQNIEKISAVIVAIHGKPLQIVCVLKQPTQGKQAAPAQANQGKVATLSEPLADVSNIFDGAELLE